MVAATVYDGWGIDENGEQPSDELIDTLVGKVVNRFYKLAEVAGYDTKCVVWQLDTSEIVGPVGLKAPDGAATLREIAEQAQEEIFEEWSDGTLNV